MKHLHCGIIASILLFSVTAVYAAALFNNITIEEDTGGAVAVAAADFNGDDYVDFVYTCNPQHHLKWMENDGTQHFTPHLVIEDFTRAKAVDTGDINGDGHVDFAATSDHGNRISWFENDGTGDFTEHVLSTAWIRPAYLQVTDHFLNEPVDINGDDLTDIVVVSCQSDRVGWFENNGDGTFTEHLLYDDWAAISCVSVADIDNDNDTDMLLACHEAGFVWLENIGDDEVFPQHVIFTEWDQPNWVAAGDIDGDNDVDFAGTSCGTSQAVGWFENLGNQSFECHTLRENYAGARSPVICDIEEDGDVDIFSIAWQSREFTFFENNGDEDFTEHTVDNNAFDMLKLFVVDLDSDGDSDLLASSAVSANVHLRWYEAIDHFLQPNVSASDVSGHAPLTIQFADLSYARPNVETCEWDFDGDGQTDATGATAEHTYSVPGEYPATVTLSNGEDVEQFSIDPSIRVFDGESCVEFNGENSMCDAGNAAALTLAGDYTFEAWVCPDTYGESGEQGGRIFDKGVVSLHTSSGSADGYVALVVRMAMTENTTFMAWTDSDALQLHTWSHVALTYESSTQSLALYVNGEAAELTWVTPPAGDIIQNTAFAFVIGNSAGGVYTFDGHIDEVRLWNLPRTQGEIASSMQDYLTGDETGLVGYWRMNEGSGGAAADMTANGDDLNVVNAMWAQGTPFEFTPVDEGQSPPPVGLSMTNYPNPFNPTTTFSFSLTEPAQIALTIYNVKGQCVRRFEDKRLPAGEHQLHWDGADDNGHPASSGVYMATLDSNGERQSVRKCLLLK